MEVGARILCETLDTRESDNNRALRHSSHERVESSGPGQKKGLVWATDEIFTVAICTIGVRAAELGVSFLNYFGRSPSGRSERHSQLLISKISLMITRSFLQDGYAKA